MDALLSAFLAALLAEQGDTSQFLVATIAATYGARPRIVAAILIAVAANAALAAAGGAVVHALMPYRATLLLTALALLFAGGGALLRAGKPKVVLYQRLGAPLAVLVAMLAQLFGDKTQFLTFALAARSDAPALAAAGTTLGTIAGLAPALALGGRFATTWPARPLRWASATLFLIAGVIVALAALRLI